MSASGAHRVLKVLQQNDLVNIDPKTSKYQLSLAFFRLAWRTASHFPLLQTALPLMQDLTATCNETVLLSLFDPIRMEMMFIASVDSSHPIRHVVELNRWLPVYLGASGLAIMAFLSAGECKTIVAKANEELPKPRALEPTQFTKRLEQIRRRGYALTVGGRTPGVVGIAAPFWGLNHRVAGSLVLTILEQRYRRESEDSLIEAVIETADRITKLIGGASDSLSLPSAAGNARLVMAKSSGGGQ